MLQLNLLKKNMWIAIMIIYSNEKAIFFILGSPVFSCSRHSISETGKTDSTITFIVLVIFVSHLFFFLATHQVSVAASSFVLEVCFGSFSPLRGSSQLYSPAEQGEGAGNI